MKEAYNKYTLNTNSKDDWLKLQKDPKQIYTFDASKLVSSYSKIRAEKDIKSIMNILKLAIIIIIFALLLPLGFASIYLTGNTFFGSFIYDIPLFLISLFIAKRSLDVYRKYDQSLSNLENWFDEVILYEIETGCAIVYFDQKGLKVVINEINNNQVKDIVITNAPLVQRRKALYIDIGGKKIYVFTIKEQYENELRNF